MKIQTIKEGLQLHINSMKTAFIELKFGSQADFQTILNRAGNLYLAELKKIYDNSNRSEKLQGNGRKKSSRNSK